MKKFLISSILFSSIFFGINCVNAEVTYDKTFTDFGGSLHVTFDNETKILSFDSSSSSGDGTIQITKENYLFYYQGNGMFFVQQYDTDSLYLVSYNSSLYILSLSSSGYNYNGLDMVQYLYSSGPLGGGTSWSNPFRQQGKDFNKTGSSSFDSRKDYIYTTTDILDTSGNVVKEKNLEKESKVVNKVIDLGDNSFGFYQDYVGLNLTTLTGTSDTLSIVCEEDRPFSNNYCFINYNDLINHNSDITVFNDYGASFTQLFGTNTGYLLNDRYYLYSFRIQKPFVPQVGNLFINSLTNNSNQVDILGVYLQDGGSYTDYVVKFKISNSDYSSSTSLNDITVVFRDGLSSYFSTIPTSFNYSVYRSFKLQYFSTEPTMEQVNKFYNSSDLSSIDGISSNNSFFTDNDFNTFGFGGIITAPFRFLYAIESYQTCSDIVLPFPHSNNTITLKCVRSSIPSSINPLISILQIILSGFISYRIAVETLSIIKDISSPDVANIEVVDL